MRPTFICRGVKGRTYAHAYLTVRDNDLPAYTILVSSSLCIIVYVYNLRPSGQLTNALIIHVAMLSGNRDIIRKISAQFNEIEWN